MSIVHLVAGYDRRTERLVVEHAIPEAIFDEIRTLADVPETDGDAIGSYPLSATAARTIATKLPALLNVDTYDWFLEPAADH